jgi:hypothetical protein
MAIQGLYIPEDRMSFLTRETPAGSLPRARGTVSCGPSLTQWSLGIGTCGIQTRGGGAKRGLTGASMFCQTEVAILKDTLRNVVRQRLIRVQDEFSEKP